MRKYKLLNESLKAIKDHAIKLLILKGEAGFGKTYTTLKYITQNKLNHIYINTYITPLAFYKLLYKNRNRKVLVFDDLHGVNDPKIKAMFKSICWENKGRERIVNYYSTTPLLKSEEIPPSFKFNSSVVLIFNKNLFDFETIVNRGISIDFKFSFKEKIEIFEHFQKDANIEKEVLDYVKKKCGPATQNLSIRTLVILSDLKRKNYDFKIFAKEILKVDEDVNELIKLSATEWNTKTGLSRATYYRNKKKLRIK